MIDSGGIITQNALVWCDGIFLTSQYKARQWIIAVRQQAITETIVEWGRWRHPSSLGPNEQPQPYCYRAFGEHWAFYWRIPLYIIPFSSIMNASQ